MESVSDVIQLLVLAVCFVLSLVRAVRERNAAWTTLACFFSCMLLGNAYWLGYLLVFGETPHYSYIAEMSWIAGYVFLLMLLVEADKQRGVSAPVPAAWVPVGVCALCCAYYIATSGTPLLNLADNGLVAALGFFAVRGLAANPKKRIGSGFAGNRPLHVAALVLVAVEQALWLSSAIPGAAPDYTAYAIVNFILTASYAAILACAWRSDAP